MNKLIKNELKKIFKKKVLYILLCILIGICVLVTIMNKVTEKDNEYYNENEKGYYEQTLKMAKENQDIELERECKTYLQAYELAAKYEEGSWQRYIIETEVQPIIESMLKSKQTEGYETYKEEYDRLINLINANDWKIFAQEKLDSINSQLSTIENEDSVEVLKYQKQALEWRLEKNIPYDDMPLNAYITSWENAKIQEIDFKNIKNPTRDEKRNNERNKATIEICEYAIKNNINKNVIDFGKNTVNDELRYKLKYDAKALLTEVIINFGFIIFFATIIVAGGIVSDEFNKGTIKLLLVRPYTRTKILMSKFISCLIILVISIISVLLVQTIVGGIVYGFDSYGNETLVYNFNTNSIISQGILQTIVMMIIYLLPKFLLVLTIAFAISTLATNSTLAIIIPTIIMMEELFLNMLATTVKKAKFLLCFVTPNWDLSQYANGATSPMKELTLPFSIIICIVYFIGLLAISIRSFDKKNIKNV